MQSFDFTGTRRVLTILGSGTSVGKTLCALGIIDSILKKLNHLGDEKIAAGVVYLKPWQTGYPKDSDQNFIASRLHNPARFEGHTFSKNTSAVSPHLAAEREGSFQKDNDVLKKIVDLVVSSDQNSWIFVEGAGGVLSPTGEGTLQADFFRKIRMPVLFVGDSKLGGISATISAMESLHSRGLDVAAVVLEQNDLQNHVYLKEKLKSHFASEIPVFTFSSFEEDVDQWLRKSESVFSAIVTYLDSHFASLQNHHTELINVGTKCVWWPFTQHGRTNSKTPAREAKLFLSAHQDWLCTHEGRSLHDSSASWWTQCLGHAPVELARSLGYAAARYGHVMYPDNFSEPTVQLCNFLIENTGNDWAQKVFLSDNGSTAVEVGLKMAFRLNEARQNKTQHIDEPKVLALQNTYHGDTLGAMCAVAPSDFNAKEPWYSGRGVFLDYPVLAQKKVCNEGLAWFVLWQGDEFILESDPYDLNNECPVTLGLKNSYEWYFDKNVSFQINFGCLILEPLVHGSGGMQLVHPLFQALLIDRAKNAKLPVIFDEVFVGLWRCGFENVSKVLLRAPDISCYSKCLSGGMMSLGATLATDEVFDAFRGEDKKSALLHGHSYSGNPIAATAALAALRALNKENALMSSIPSPMGQDGRFERTFLNRVLESPCVEWAWTLGTVFAAKLKNTSQKDIASVGYHASIGKQLCDLLKKEDVFARPLGNSVYLMLSHTSAHEDVTILQSKFLNILDKGLNS